MNDAITTDGTGYYSVVHFSDGRSQVLDRRDTLSEAADDYGEQTDDGHEVIVTYYERNKDWKTPPVSINVTDTAAQLVEDRMMARAFKYLENISTQRNFK